MFIVTTDLHFTDKPSELFRLDIFPWLKEKALKHQVKDVFLLGDLTTAKDKHSAKLVNDIIDGLTYLDMLVHILMGNHDYVEISNPFFRFLKTIPNINFYTEPKLVTTQDRSKCLMIPHVKDDWPDLNKYLNKYGKPDYVMLHQTVEGAIAESGARLNGLSTAPIEAVGARKVFSGDIHRPQVCGPVTYVGSPYNVRFGDDFKPRVLLVDSDNDDERNLYFKAPRKYVLHIRDTDQITRDERLKAGDHVKVVLELAREEFVEWPNYKRSILEVCKEMQLQMFGVQLLKKPEVKRVRIDTPTGKPIRNNKDIFKGFCKREKLSSTVREVGYELLKGTA